MTKFLNISTDNTLGGNSPSDSTVSSQKAIKTLIDTKQDTLVSGTNIKTVNNVSLLGSGNITISGSGAVDSVNGKTGTVVLSASDVGAIDIANNSTVTASDALNSVVTTTGITKSSSGYVKLGNGLIIQWVRIQGTQSQNQDVTLPTAFTSADSFTATATIFGVSESMYPVSIQAQTATTVQLHRYTGNLTGFYFNIIAIGY